MTRAYLALAAALMIAAAVEAFPRNLADAVLARQLARAGVFGEAGTAAAGKYSAPGASTRLPPSVRETVLVPWDLLLNHPGGDDTARALLRARDAGTGFGMSLDALARTPAPLGWPDEVVPFGLPEYEYGLAMRALDQRDWPGGLEHFERAVMFRPGPWPAHFVTRYRAALSADHAAVIDRLTREESTPADSWAQVDVGRKDMGYWGVPIETARGWRLENFALQSFTPADLGLPVTVRLTWLANSGIRTNEVFAAWNMVANGGFELNAGSASGEFGWFHPLPDGRAASPVQRGVVHNGRTSNAVFLAPSGNISNGVSGRPIPVTPGAFLLWHVWIKTTPGANPFMFVSWRDANNARIADEIPIQDTPITKPEFDYAGVLHVPEAARYVSIMLTNWRTTRGTTLWDDVLLIPIRPPS
jgi:hypothetical protein